MTAIIGFFALLCIAGGTLLLGYIGLRLTVHFDPADSWDEVSTKDRWFGSMVIGGLTLVVVLVLWAVSFAVGLLFI